jgi:hypothetical protein
MKITEFLFPALFPEKHYDTPNTPNFNQSAHLFAEPYINAHEKIKEKITNRLLVATPVSLLLASCGPIYLLHLLAKGPKKCSRKKYLLPMTTLATISGLIGLTYSALSGIMLFFEYDKIDELR